MYASIIFTNSGLLTLFAFGIFNSWFIGLEVERRRRSRDTSGRAHAVQPRTNECPGGLLDPRERAAGSSVQVVCTPLPSVSRSLQNVRLSHLWRQRNAITCVFRLKLGVYLTDILRLYCPSLWAACGGLTGGFSFCEACDTDKRPRRVHVSRMLPGKGEREEGAFFLSRCVWTADATIAARLQQDMTEEPVLRWILRSSC